MKKIALSLLVVFSLLGAANPKATALIQKADALDAKGDQTGALSAYIEAVKIDPSVHDYRRITAYVVNHLNPDNPEEKKQFDAIRARETEALRLYIARYSDEYLPLRELTLLLAPAEGEKLLTSWIAAHPNDGDAYMARAWTRARGGRFTEAFADLDKRFEICPVRLSLVATGEVAQEAAKSATLKLSEKEAFLARGEKSLRRAMKLDPDALEPAAYLSGLLREEASLTKDEEKQKALIAEADALRANMVAAIRAKKASWRSLGMTIDYAGGDAMISDRGAIHIPRAPFTLRVHLPENLPVMLNVTPTDAVQWRVWPGFSPDCKSVAALCAGAGVAEEPFNKAKSLWSGEDRMHYLYYESEDDHRWTSMRPSDSGPFFAREVAAIDDVPIEKTTMPALYFVVAAPLDDDGVIEPEELIRFTLRFD